MKGPPLVRASRPRELLSLIFWTATLTSLVVLLIFFFHFLRNRPPAETSTSESSHQPGHYVNQVGEAVNNLNVNQAVEAINKENVKRSFSRRFYANNATSTHHLDMDSKGSSVEQEGYLVWSPQCQIPDVDVWHKITKTIIKPVEPLSCSDLPPLSEVRGDDLLLLTDNFKFYAKEEFTCCYQEITRRDSQVFHSSSDNAYRLSECWPLNDSVTLRDEQQFVLVTCDLSYAPRVYRNVHARVTLREDVREKIFSVPKDETKTSVLLIVIDSLSRLNLLRTMPKTYGHLREKGWLEMKGYSRVGYDTPPNAYAMLMGLSEDDVRKTCKISTEPMDDCPLIWRDFSAKGYVTAYGEDLGGIPSTFNIQSRGFMRPPTDYYLRPFFLAAEDNTDARHVENTRVCVGQTSEVDHIFKYARDFSVAFHDEPTFGVFWINGLSHNDISTSQELDTRTFNFLKDLDRSQAMNNTFMMLLSDHGQRNGRMPRTFTGDLELNLPAQFIRVPQRFKTEHPRKYANLLSNTDKLTSSYDVYLTLRELLDGTPQKGTASCPGCVSLLQKVPRDRTCRDAGVPDPICSCSLYSSLADQGPSVQELVNHAVRQINSLLERGDSSTKCARLSVRTVLTRRVKMLSSNVFAVAFQTIPGFGIFEAIFRYDNGPRLHAIYRMNMHTVQSGCIDIKELKRFCFCVDGLDGDVKRKNEELMDYMV